MIYKKLSTYQILISLDRLTRFKNPKDKYFRVFCDIITSSLLEPKLKKIELEKMDFEKLKNIAVEIFNNSIENKLENNNIINKKLLNYEKSVFVVDDETEKLLNNNLDYNSAKELISDSDVVNLIWLKSLSLETDSETLRIEKSLKYPISKVLLVEGLTEEILLPAFSKFLGHDFYKYGIQIIPAGGKNQVVKLYYKLREELKIPIYILLDKDAEENIRQIKPKLRKQDKIHPVSCGEFEDILPKSLIVKTINARFKNFVSINEEEFDKNLTTAENLDNIFKTVGTCDFKKADFAKLVREQISSENDISDEIKNIINEIFI